MKDTEIAILRRTFMAALPGAAGMLVGGVGVLVFAPPSTLLVIAGVVLIILALIMVAAAVIFRRADERRNGD